jgi:aryl-alcohol dehydrogenase-like predicted oxidoreductase
MAAEIDITPAQLALAWLLHRPQGRVIPILGARSVEQFDENLQCLDISLTAAQVAALDELSEPQHAYPTSLLNNDFFRSLIYGELAGKISR